MLSKRLDQSVLKISILISVVTLLILLIIIFSVRYLIKDDLMKHNESMLEMTYDQIVNVLNKSLSQIESVDTIVKEYDYKETIVETYLASFVNNYAYVEQIILTDQSGDILNMVKTDLRLIGSNLAYEDYFINKRIGKWTFSNVFYSNYSNRNVLAAILDQGDYVIIVELVLSELPVNLIHEEYFNENIEAFMLDEYGTYILSNDPKQVEGRYRYDYFDMLTDCNEDVLFVENTYILNKCNPEMNWYLVLEADNFKAYGIINRITWSILLIWLIFAILLFRMVSRYYKRVKKGINVLQSHTKDILEDHYEFDLEPLYFDEFEHLDNKFRHMARTIDLRTREIVEINEQLEAKVLERTALFEEANKSLMIEAEEREIIAEELKQMNMTLDQKVKSRTQQLSKLNEELQESIKTAKEANESKGRFLAVMSHEMRTPLNGIIGFANMLKADAGQLHSENINMILSSSQILLSLINDVLDIAKYESGEMQFEKVSFNLYQILRGVLDPLGAQIKSKGLQFEVDNLNTLDIDLVGDPVKLQQLLNNLLNNALKFTEQGTITVNFMLEMGDRIKLTCQIKDTGIGMSPRVLANVFHPFKQADNSIHRRFGGTGLGLTICKEIVERLDGEIFFDSIEDVGTTCEFNLYLDSKSSDTIFIEEVNHKSTKVNKVLVVEDHMVNQTLVKKFLDKYKVKYDLAENGQIAVNLYENNDYDVILMDCQMPVMDGFEASKIIRSMNKSNPDIIAMTAYTSEEDRIRCRNAGMNKFLPKPLDLSLLSEILGIKEAFTKDISHTKANKVNYLDKYTKELQEKIGFDEETCRELVETFKEQITVSLRKIDDAIAINDYETIRKTLHQIKGASATVRIEDIHIKAKNAELMMHAEMYDKAFKLIERIKLEGLLNE